VNIIDGILSRKVFGGLKPHLEMEIQLPGTDPRLPRDDLPLLIVARKRPWRFLANFGGLVHPKGASGI